MAAGVEDDPMFVAMTEALQRLDGHLRPAMALNKYWLPGIDVSAVFTEVFGTTPPPEARAWYWWHGGMDGEAIERAYETGELFGTTVAPDGLEHRGPDSLDVRGIVEWTESMSAGLPFQPSDGSELFPIGEILQGMACLRRGPGSETWHMCCSHPEDGYEPSPYPVNKPRVVYDLQDEEARTRQYQDDIETGPTLLEYVSALNHAFEANHVEIADGAGPSMSSWPADDSDVPEAFFLYPWVPTTVGG